MDFEALIFRFRMEIYQTLSQNMLPLLKEISEYIRDESYGAMLHHSHATITGDFPGLSCVNYRQLPILPLLKASPGGTINIFLIRISYFTFVCLCVYKSVCLYMTIFVCVCVSKSVVSSSQG